MTIAYASVLSENQLNDLFDFSSLDRPIESACRLTVQDPKALYLFRQRYAHFNGYAASLVARLASSVGLSRYLFNYESVNITKGFSIFFLVVGLVGKTLHCIRLNP